MADRPNQKLDPTKSFTPNNAPGSGQQQSRASVPSTPRNAWANGPPASLRSNVPASNPAQTNAPLRLAPSNTPFRPAPSNTPFRPAPSNAPLRPTQPNIPRRPAQANAARSDRHSSSPQTVEQPRTDLEIQGGGLQPDCSSQYGGGLQYGGRRRSGHQQTQRRLGYGQASGSTLHRGNSSVNTQNQRGPRQEQPELIGTNKPARHQGPGPKEYQSQASSVVPANAYSVVTGKHLLANHFKIFLGIHKHVYSYKLEFREVIRQQIRDPKSRNAEDTIERTTENEVNPAKPKKARLIWLYLRFLNDHTQLSNPLATDFIEKIITAEKLDDTIPRSLNFMYRDEYWTAQDPRRVHEFKVVLKDPVQISLEDLFTHTRRLPATDPTAVRLSDTNFNAAINTLNVIFSYHSYPSCFIPNANSVPRMTTDNGQKFYGVAQHPAPADDVKWNTPTGKVSQRKGGTLTIPGFWRSVRATYNSPGHVDLTINTSTGCFWRHGTVQELIDAWTDAAFDWQRGRPDLIDAFIRGASIRLQHREVGLDCFMTVKGLARTVTGAGTPKVNVCNMIHPDQQHNNTTVSNYYNQVYQWPVDTGVYAIRVGKDKDDGLITVPADLLHVLPGKVNPHVKPDKTSFRTPDENYRMIITAGKDTFFGDSRTIRGAQDFDLSVQRNMVSVPVNILPPPPIMYGNREHLDIDMMCSGQWNLTKKLERGSKDVTKLKFVTPAHGKKWSCIELVPDQPPSEQGRKPGHRQVRQMAWDGPRNFAETLRQAMEDYGMTDMDLKDYYINDDLCHKWWATRFKLNSVNTRTIQEQLDAVVNLFELVKADGVQLLVVLLPSDDVNLYSAVKRAGDHVVGLPTVCHKLRPGGGGLVPITDDPRKKDDFLANLCMKINLKLDTTTVNQALDDPSFEMEPLTAETINDDNLENEAPTAPGSKSQSSSGQHTSTKSGSGQNHNGGLGEVVESQPLQQPDRLPPLPPILTDEHTMIVGIDVTHAGGSARRKSPSIAAVVSSVNAAFSQWPATLCANPYVEKDTDKQAKEEVVELRTIIYQRLLDYYRRNQNTAPKRIIVYRDGLSESQFGMCRTREYPSILAGLTMLWEQKGLDEEMPPVTLICAIKRHHTRLFPPHNLRTDELAPRDPGLLIRNNNPVPGCVVQDRITYGEGNDFFLVSQKAIQGTAIPTHYNILENPSGYSTMDIAKMTHALCFLFGRASRSVGLCTPTYYADRAANRARCFVRDFYNPVQNPSNIIRDIRRPFEMNSAEWREFQSRLIFHQDVEGKMLYI